MPLRKIVPAAALLLLMLLAGAACVKVQFFPAEGMRSYEPVKAPLMLRSLPVDRPYEEIGTVRASGGNREKILERIKKEAAERGAHAAVVKPPRNVSQTYTSEMRTEFESSEWVYEALLIRFVRPEEQK